MSPPAPDFAAAARLDDAPLIERCLARDPAAMRVLIDRLTPIVHARVSRVLLRLGRAARGRTLRQEVEDFTQEVFVSLFAQRARTLAAWRSDGGLSLNNFVGLVAERQTISILRSGRRSPWTEDPTFCDDLGRLGGHATGDQHRVLSLDELQRVLDGVRAQLSPKGLHLFELLMIEQLEVDAICAQTGMTVDAVYAWRSRLGKLARKVRAGLSGEPPAPRSPRRGDR